MTIEQQLYALKLPELKKMGPEPLEQDFIKLY